MSFEQRWNANDQVSGKDKTHDFNPQLNLIDLQNGDHKWSHDSSRENGSADKFLPGLSFNYGGDSIQSNPTSTPNAESNMGVASNSPQAIESSTTQTLANSQSNEAGISNIAQGTAGSSGSDSNPIQNIYSALEKDVVNMNNAIQKFSSDISSIESNLGISAENQQQSATGADNSGGQSFSQQIQSLMNYLKMPSEANSSPGTTATPGDTQVVSPATGNNGDTQVAANPTTNNGDTQTVSPGSDAPTTVASDGLVVNSPASDGPVTPGTWQNESINGMNYQVLLPANYDPANKYPVVLYEHQLDMGTDVPDLDNQVNAWFNTTEFRTDHPAIVVMPLLDQTADPSGETINFGGVSSADQPGQDNAIAALQQVQSQYSTDPSRVYMTGNSLGGIGTWDTLLKYNAYNGTQGQIIDAAMPLAGNDYAIPADRAAQELAAGQVPVHSYHGADDTQVPNGFDEQVASDLSNGSQSDANFAYTEVPNTGHDVWDGAYTDPSTWNWLFSQQGPTAASTSA